MFCSRACCLGIDWSSRPSRRTNEWNLVEYVSSRSQLPETQTPWKTTCKWLHDSTTAPQGVAMLYKRATTSALCALSPVSHPSIIVLGNQHNFRSLRQAASHLGIIRFQVISNKSQHLSTTSHPDVLLSGSSGSRQNGRRRQTRPGVDVLPCVPPSVAEGRREHRMPCMPQRIHRNCTSSLYYHTRIIAATNDHAGQSRESPALLPQPAAGKRSEWRGCPYAECTRACPGANSDFDSWPRR